MICCGGHLIICMSDEYLYLWAQWGILNAEQYRIVLEHFGNLEEAWKRITPEFLFQLGMRNDKPSRLIEIKNKLSFEEISRTMKHFDIKLYHLDDEEYPSNLKETKAPPPFLFVRGELPSFHKSLSIVGARKMTDYGRNITRSFTADLVRSGFVIVSGLALGVDSVAHKTTLESHGKTVAVLGTGVDVIYPASNHRLAQNIVSSDGAVISAFPLGTHAQPFHFPKRNYIISGLTQGVLVVEGGDKSGALITARAALGQGREVFAIPGNITRFALSGANKLIRKGEAKLVENVDHILEEFEIQGTLMKEEKEFTPDQQIVLEQLSFGGKTMDNLYEETRFNIPELSHILVMLQLDNVVDKQDNRWVLI